MKNTDLISKRLDEALTYLYKQEEKLKPVMEFLQSKLVAGIKDEEISAKDAFDMLYKLNEQYTNSVLLITKIQEIIDFNE